jgi:hypothetical protein
VPAVHNVRKHSTSQHSTAQHNSVTLIQLLHIPSPSISTSR